LLQAGQDQLQKFLRDLLTPRDIGDFDRFARGLHREIEKSQKSVLALH